MEELKDYYEILGLSYTSKPEKELITAAYKAKVKLYHPDVYKGKDSEKIIKDINEAYETLKSKTKKKDYDEAYEEYFYSDEETLDEEEFEEDKEEGIKKDYSNEVNIKDEFYDESKKDNDDVSQEEVEKAFRKTRDKKTKPDLKYELKMVLGFLCFSIPLGIWLDATKNQPYQSPNTKIEKTDDLSEDNKIEKIDDLSENKKKSVDTVKKNEELTYDVYTWPNGIKYEGYWKGNIRHGYGVNTWPDGDRYEGNWKDNRRHGYGVFSYFRAESYEGNWKDDKLHGFVKITYPNGHQFEGNFKNDEKHGIGIYTYSDGRTVEVLYENGERK